MNKSEIAILIKFNFWANDRILSTCDRIFTNEFTRLLTPDPGWGSLRGILVHILDTEYGWRSVLQALDEEGIMAEGDFADVSALKTRWKEEQTAWIGFLDTLNDEDINLGYGDDPLNGPMVWQTIMHVVTHGIQHRSEAAAILTGFGHSPGELDFDLFLKEESESK